MHYLNCDCGCQAIRPVDGDVIGNNGNELIRQYMLKAFERVSL